MKIQTAVLSLPFLFLGCRTNSSVEITEDTSNCELNTWFRDADGDGHGDPEFAAKECDAPAGFVKDGDDCDDEDSYSYSMEDEDGE
jgi:hypothetical protein